MISTSKIRHTLCGLVVVKITANDNTYVYRFCVLVLTRLTGVNIVKFCTVHSFDSIRFLFYLELVFTYRWSNFVNTRNHINDNIIIISIKKKPRDKYSLFYEYIDRNVKHTFCFDVLSFVHWPDIRHFDLNFICVFFVMFPFHEWMNRASHLKEKKNESSFHVLAELTLRSYYSTAQISLILIIY